MKTEFLVSPNVPLLQVTHSRTLLLPIFTGLPGITLTIRHNMQVRDTKFSFRDTISNHLTGGILGPMIIHGPSNALYDIDLGPVLLTDYFHEDYFTIVEGVVGNGTQQNITPKSDNNLINGKMNFDCSTVAAGDNSPCNNNAGISKFTFTTGKTHRLRLINAGAEALQRFSIDQHTMTVIANDFVPVVSILYLPIHLITVNQE